MSITDSKRERATTPQCIPASKEVVARCNEERRFEFVTHDGGSQPSKLDKLAPPEETDASENQKAKKESRQIRKSKPGKNLGYSGGLRVRALQAYSMTDRIL